MKKIILTLALLFNVGLFAQEEPTVTFDDVKGLYLVQTDADNFHYVTEDGVLHGPFMHTFENIVIKGSMRYGKRHGTLIKYVDGIKSFSAEYKRGDLISYTNIIINK